MSKRIGYLTSISYLYSYMRQQEGAEYYKAMELCPEKVLPGFKAYMIVKGREIETNDKRLIHFIKWLIWHELNTRPRLLIFKAQNGVTDTDLAKALGYNSRVSFVNSPKRWTRIRKMLDAVDFYKSVLERNGV